MITDKSDSERYGTSRPEKKRKRTRKEHRKARSQALVPRQSLASPFASPADVFDKYRFREKLKAVPFSVLKSDFESLKMDTSNEGPSRSSDTGSDEHSHSRPSCRHQDADLRNTQVG